jgi:hypothetical protein
MSGRTFCLVLVSGVLSGVTSAALAADSWVRVGSGGLGRPARTVANALAVHDGYVWVASRADGPHLFRAGLLDDDRWSEVSLPWAASGQEISDLESFAGDLYAATTSGHIWRYRRVGGWSDATPAWTGRSPVHALGVRPLPSGAATLCAARGSVEVYCGVGGKRTERLPDVPLADFSTVGGGDLVGFRDRLFLAVSGESAGSRTCEVLAYDEGWSPVTTDCFGNSARTWAGRMAVYQDHLYVGTGGHTDNGIYRVTYEGEFSDATPDFYAFEGLRRVPSAAVAASLLFMGGHVSLSPAGSADVIRTDGATWTRSVDPGFGSELNLVTTALAGQDTQLYAGTFNGEGFEVWRRNFLLVEIVTETAPGYRRWVREARQFHRCLRLGSSSACVDRLLLAQRIERVKVAFDTARHPADDAKLILEIRRRFAGAEKALARSLAIAARADGLAAQQPRAAAWLYGAARRHLVRAVLEARSAWRMAVAATGLKQKADF